MKKRTLLFGVAVLALAGAAAYTQGIRSPEAAIAFARDLKPLDGAIAWVQGFWQPQKAVAQAEQRGRGGRGGQAGRVVPVEVTAAAKKRVPVVLNALGTVTPIASVAVKARLESTIIGVHFEDGAMVKKGDLLFTLDSRQIQAQIDEIEAIIASAKAQLEQNQRDLERYRELAAKNATTQVQVNNTRTQVNIWTSAVNSNTAKLENLKIQLSHCSIQAPIAGRMSAANVKVGNFVRPADVAPLATINQIAPVYVSFTVSQQDLPDVRRALAAETATVSVAVPGEDARAGGQVTMIENTVDPATGMVMVRATMPNADQLLWPGTLVNTDLLLRVEEGVTVPSLAVQSGQAGTYVFVIKQGAAQVRPVTVARTVEHESVVAKGLAPGELVATDGQLLLGDGTKVRIRNQQKAGS
jgi:RND family efflux transporter MFP subunit